MKKINLLDILGSLDNKMINEAIEIDNSVKLKELKKREKCTKIFKFATIFACSIVVFTIGLALINNSAESNVLITNPMTQVNDISDLESYINLDLKKYKIKEIKEMFKFESEALIQIKYVDESTLRISKGSKDNSGIMGATLDNTLEINDKNVNIYKLDNTVYAMWQNDNYSFSYVFSDIDDISLVLSKLV